MKTNGIGNYFGDECGLVFGAECGTTGTGTENESASASWARLPLEESWCPRT